MPSGAASRSLTLLFAVLVAVCGVAYGGQGMRQLPIRVPPGDTAINAGNPTVEASSPVMFGVGDIGWCADITRTRATGRLMQTLLDTTPGSLGFTTGDNSNDSGTEDDYGCLQDTAWATLAPRLLSVPGNHDYQTDNVFPYYMLYFPKGRGATNDGYYSYDVGNWHVMAINSEVLSKADAMRERRLAELNWIDQDLKRNSERPCTMAYFHRPPFSSGRFASPAYALPIFQRLYQGGVDLVVTGHEHFFAAYPPLNPEGKMDDAFGIPIVTAGTGGAPFFPDPVKRNYHEMLLTGVPGVVKLALGQKGFDWWFIDTNGNVPRFATGREVSGSERCHGRPEATAPAVK